MHFDDALAHWRELDLHRWSLWQHIVPELYLTAGIVLHQMSKTPPAICYCSFVFHSRPCTDQQRQRGVNVVFPTQLERTSLTLHAPSAGFTRHHPQASWSGRFHCVSYEDGCLATFVLVSSNGPMPGGFQTGYCPSLGISWTGCLYSTHNYRTACSLCPRLEALNGVAKNRIQLLFSIDLPNVANGITAYQNVKNKEEMCST